MKISIVTISFNQSRFLEAAILSVLNQNHSDVEYIVVDPGSTDGSRDIIEKYRDRISKVVFEKDAGAADGLNKGFSYATGDVLGYLNSDDLLEAGALSSVNDHFSTNDHVDIIYGHGYVIDAFGVLKRRCYSDRFNLKSAAYGAAVTIQPSTFFRREYFEKAGGFNPGNKSNWDGELLIDMVRAGAEVMRVDEFYSSYRVHGQGITGTGRLAALHQAHSMNMFKKIMGREFQPADRYVGRLFRIRKHLLHPVSTLERIRFGPIFGQEV